MNDDTFSRSDALDVTTSREAIVALPDDQPDLAGRVLDGRFRVEARLGRGGMGAVYRATQIGVTERAVAIKVILPDRIAGADALARFEREARAAAKLGHPNTLRIFEFGQTPDGIPYLVTELLVGSSLADELGRAGALPVGRAIRIAIQTLASLSEAHQLGIVHRDLKPDNLFLADVVGATDFVKVIDFGLATLPADQADQRLTAAGQTLGTPAYMSPEQVHGHVVGPAGDLYSMGVILFEMVSGRRPFVGSTPFDTMRAHVMDPAPALEIAGGLVPHELREVVARCLEKRPEHRPASADELRQTLAAILEGVTVESPRPPMTADPEPALPQPQPSGGDSAILPAGRSTQFSGGESAILPAGRSPQPSGGESVIFPPRRSPLPWVIGAVVGLAALAVGVLWGGAGRQQKSLPGASQPAAEGAAPAGAGEASGEGPAPSSAAPGAAAISPSPGVSPAPPVAVLRAEEEPERLEDRPLTPHVQVSVESLPPHATVAIDGRVLGRTPVTAWLPEGASRRAVVQRSGYRVTTVELAGQGDAPVVVKLKVEPAGLDVMDFAPEGDERALKHLTTP